MPTPSKKWTGALAKRATVRTLYSDPSAYRDKLVDQLAAHYKLAHVQDEVKRLKRLVVRMAIDLRVPASFVPLPLGRRTKWPDERRLALVDAVEALTKKKPDLPLTEILRELISKKEWRGCTVQSLRKQYHLGLALKAREPDETEWSPYISGPVRGRS